jgi:hypothetical protein
MKDAITAIKKIKNKIFAIPANAVAIPPNPKIPDKTNKTKKSANKPIRTPFIKKLITS